MRLVKFLCGLAALTALLFSATATTSVAATPYPVNLHLRAHQQVEFDPNWLFEAQPCFVALGDLTEVFNGEAHALASGIDDQGDLIPPLHVQKTVTESVLFVPYDSTLPTYTGRSTVHTNNLEDSPNAGFTNTTVLRGSDGSHVLLHETLHILVKPSGIVLFIDHRHANC